MHILALQLPNHLEIALWRVKRDLFSQFGLSSALALPPLIPLYFPKKPLALGELTILGETPITSFQTVDFLAQGADLYLELRFPNSWKTLITSLNSTSSFGTAWKTPFPGIYLGTSLKKAETVEVVTALEPFPATTFKPLNIALFQIRLAAQGHNPWWENCLLEQLWTYRQSKSSNSGQRDE